MSRKLRSIMLVLLSAIAAIALVVPSSLAYLIEITPPVRNTFVMDPVLTELQIPITVRKTVKSLCERPVGPEGFTFVLTNTQTGETRTMVSDAEGKASLTLSFCGLDAGDHSFTIYEQNDGRSGMIYDGSVYRVLVRITMDELPKAEIMINDKAVNVCEVSFENLYKEEFPEIPETGDPAQPLLWLGLMLASGCAMAALLVRRSKLV